MTETAGSRVTACGVARAFESNQYPVTRPNRLLKAATDSVIAFPLLLASLPVMALAAAWIKLCSGGPAFYGQLREGLGGQPLRVWKLRTMHLNGDDLLDNWFRSHPEDHAYWQLHFKLRRDPRILPGIGKLLRRTSLDELPQLWSVLKG